MDYEKVLGESKFPTYEKLKTGLLRLIDEGKISREDAARLLPELRESEDERARRAALEGIEYLERKLGWDAIGDTDILDVKEYLEKQKEHHIPWYDYQKSKEAGYTIVPNEEYEQLIKQKEQKPEDKEITLTNFEEVLNTFLFDFANSPIEDCEPKEYTKKHSAEILKAAYAELNAQLKQDIFEAQQEGRREGYEAAKAEQKPAEWSEEDEKKIGRLRSVVNQLASYTDSLDVNGDYCEGDYAELDTWLKSLRPQPQGTYKLIVHNIYEMLKDKDFFDIPPSHRVSLLNDIRVRCKNADEQAEILGVPSWKPSEEHLSALLAIFNDPDNIGSQTCQLALTDLYEQLKKL